MKKHINITILGLLALGAMLPAAEPVRPGAADFLPTPASPIGFRGDNNAWYPAANPPIEWWDGRPAMVEEPKASNRKPTKVLGYADQIPKNILWKTRLPSWGESQPLVVGQRIIVLGEPDLILCYDANTGQELWRDRVALMSLPSLGKDRRSLEAAPADAAKRQVIWELARASAYLHRNVRSSDTAEFIAQATKAAATWTEWKRLIEANDPRFSQIADKVLATLTEMKSPDKAAALAKGYVEDGNHPDPFVPLCGDWALLTKEYKAPIPAISLGSGLYRNMVSNVGSVFSTPASDGKVVLSVFGYGQVVCHDLVTGKRLWAWRDPLGPTTPGGDQIPSPRIWQDIVMVRSYAGTEMLGIKLSDGSVVWEADLNGTQPPGAGNKIFGNYVSPMVVHLADGKGGKVPVLITNLGFAVRPSDGAIISDRLFTMPENQSLSINLLPGEKLLVVENGCGTCGVTTRATIYQLKIDSAGRLVSTPLPQIPDFAPGGRIDTRSRRPDHPEYLTQIQQMERRIPNYFHGESLAVNDRFICGDRNITTLTGQCRWGGYQTAGFFVGPEMAPVIAGQYLIGGMCGEKKRTRADGACTTPMKVWNLTSRLPWLIAEYNLVGDTTLPSDPIWEKYLKPAGYELKRNVGNDHGIFGFFGNRLGGAVPQGDRLYVQSMTHLYCIGPATKGTPQDDPKAVTALHAEKDPMKVAVRLGDASAYYRLEGLRRLRSIGPVPTELVKQVTNLIVNDPYEEIRAAAIEVLDATQAGSGTAVLMAELTAFATTPVNWWEAEAKGVLLRRSWHAATLRVLGDKIDAPLAKALTEAKPNAQQILLMIAAYAGLGGPHLEQAVTTYLRGSKRGREFDVAVLDAIDVLNRSNKTQANAAVIISALLTQTTGFTNYQNIHLNRILSTIDLLIENGQGDAQVASILGNFMVEGVDAVRMGVLKRIRDLGKPASALIPQLEKYKTAQPAQAWFVDQTLNALR